MRLSKLFQAFLVGAAALWMGTGGAFAVCDVPFGGFAIFQCGEAAFFQASPMPITFDPTGHILSGATAVFWQVGFGNEILNTGLSTAGTGNTGLSTFTGNDQGIAPVDIGEASTITGNPGLFPPGALCLGNVNWGNSGIDGCADNDRTTSLLLTDNDDILNPVYDVYAARSVGAPGYYSRDWYQDYPIAVLLRTAPDQKFFAFAAVATADRGNDHSGNNGPCNTTLPGTNPAPCDFSLGSYNFKGIRNGFPNPVPGSGGGNNVIPWQMVPRPKVPLCVSGCTGVQTRVLNFQWDAVKLYNDGSRKRSSHPNMGGDPCLNLTGIACPGPQTNDPTRAAGVGVVDVMAKAVDPNNNWRGLVRYNLQSAALSPVNLDPNGRIMYSTLSFFDVFVDIPQPGVDPNGDATGPVTKSSVTVAPDTCWRTLVKFGKKPETTATGTALCRVGKCGDKGIEASSLDPMTITCVGGALLAEDISNASATRKQGNIQLTWTTNSEVSVQSFKIYAVTAKAQKLLFEAPCAECTTGLGHTYTESIKTSSVPGAKGFIVEMISAGGTSTARANL